MNKIVQDYVLMEKVGSGQYGFVYKAENRKTKAIYAVKVMNIQKFKHTPKLSQFTNNQINILSKVNHPNIIKFVQMLRTANNYYLVYEFCNGGTLAQYIKSKGKLSQQQAIKIFMQLRNAFQTLYNEKILHRDLKPTNILFHNGVIKIADFGFCKQLVKENQMAQTMVGSPIYMAPQILKGNVYDCRADLWSLGVIFYQMLYGMCPYQETTIAKLTQLIDNVQLKFSPQVSISDNIKVFLKRILTVKYRQRITPVQFIKYPIDNTIGNRNKNAQLISFKDVAIFIRRGLYYLTQTMRVLSQYVDDSLYVKFAFLIFKINASIQRDIMKKSNYWNIIKMQNTEDKWDFVLQTQQKSIQPYGNMVKQALVRTDTSLKTKLQIQTNYIDCKYYLELIGLIENNNQLKNRLLDCFLINKHFVSVLEKKLPDFTDYTISKKTIQEKLEICEKFARNH